MQINKNQQRALQVLPVILVGGVFLMLAAGLALLSGNVYRNMARTSQQVYNRRTAMSYLVGQTRRGDEANGIHYGKFGESDALFLREDAYITILYQYDGHLCELYIEQGDEFAPEDGLQITPAESLEIQAAGDVLTYTVGFEDGSSGSVTLLARCGAPEEPS